MPGCACSQGMRIEGDMMVVPSAPPDSLDGSGTKLNPVVAFEPARGPEPETQWL